MPKPPTHALVWIPASASYELWTPGRREFFSQPLIEPLSQREQEVLCEINEGYSNQEIARHLVISPRTVKSHINSIYRKLQTKSRMQTISRVRTFERGSDITQYADLVKRFIVPIMQITQGTLFPSVLFSLAPRYLP
jgi:DNA-binding CsgD family transcriptional regulator